MFNENRLHAEGRGVRRYLFVLVLIPMVVMGFGSRDADDTATHDDELEALARSYIATLDHDLDRQAEFYTPDTHFTDPTSQLFGPAWDFRGGDAIIDFFRTASDESGTLEVDYGITSMLVESPFVIANITSTVTSCAVGLGYPGKTFTGDIHMVMILDFDGDKVRTRTDYVGYSAAGEELERMRLGLSEQDDDPRCERYVDGEGAG